MYLKETTTEKLNLHSLNFLDFNRTTNLKQIDTLLNSIVEFGKLRMPVICKTNIIDGTNKYYIIDGQHMIKGLLKYGETETTCIVFESTSKTEIVKIMATLNNVVATWKIEDYVEAYRSLGNNDYNILKMFKLSNNYTYYVAAQILGSADTLKKGTFKVTKKDAEQLSTHMNQVCSLLNTTNAKFMKGFINFYRGDTASPYNHTDFMQKLAVKANTLIIADNLNDITKQLVEIAE